jgi:hypothetical protein
MNITEYQISLFNLDKYQADFINQLIETAYLKWMNEWIDKIIALKNNQ